jgi:peptidoglycan/LPS O-acetylase OafA/YrhL
LRIFPLYYGYLFMMCVVVARWLHLDRERSEEILSYQAWLWFYLSNVLICIRGKFLVASVNHFWSLAIEEHFYLVWPTVVRLVKPERLWRACVACLVIALATRIGFHVTGVWGPAPLVFTLCRVDALAIGGLLCVLMRRPEYTTSLRRAARVTLVLTAPVVLLFFLGGKGLPLAGGLLPTVGYSLIALFFGAFLHAVLDSQGLLKRLLVHPALCTLGVYAYGLYVFHHPIRIFLQRALPFEKLGEKVGSYWLGLALHSLIAFTISMAVALASYHLYEKQFLKLKRYFTFR